MSVSFADKQVAVFGLRGTGKSTFVNNLARGYKRKALVWDPLGEVSGVTTYDTYVPELADETEFERVVAYARSHKYQLLVADEINRLALPKPHPLPPCIRDMVDYSRHWHLTVAWVARRPVQVHTDLIELADFIVCFRLTGKNDRAYLESLSEGLGDAVFSLPDYHYILVNPDRTFRRCRPVPKVRLD